MMMQSEQPGSLTEAVYRAMRADLLACRTPPGEKLRIGLLCERHRASSGAIREALSRLSAEGLVTLEPQRGFQAATISADELCDLTFARIEIEGLCLGLAIEHGGAAWEEQLFASAHRLRCTNLRAHDDAQRVSEEWANAHQAFHEALVQACPNQTLLQVRRQLYARSERYRRLSVPLADSARDVEREHGEIMAAALDRDGSRAVAALADHIQQTTQVLLDARDTAFGMVA